MSLKEDGVQKELTLYVTMGKTLSLFMPCFTCQLHNGNNIFLKGVCEGKDNINKEYGKQFMHYI